MLACQFYGDQYPPVPYGHIRIVEMMIEQSESLELDLKAKDSDGQTGYQRAQAYRETDVVNLIQTKMPSLAV